METLSVATLDLLNREMTDSHMDNYTRQQTIMHVRPARSNDIPEIAELIEPFVDDGKLLARTYDEFDELLPNFFVAIAEEDDGYHEPRILGCAALEIYSPKLAEIRSLAVSKDAQGRGVGKMLVDACVQRARERGILEVMAITSSDGFFQACGFDYTLPGAKRALFLQTRDN
jgi:N-acetylglutamate synthase-like GNAT family acetyltransferase